MQAASANQYGCVTGTIVCWLHATNCFQYERSLSVNKTEQTIHISLVSRFLSFQNNSIIILCFQGERIYESNRNHPSCWWPWAYRDSQRNQKNQPHREGDLLHAVLTSFDLFWWGIHSFEKRVIILWFSHISCTYWLW